MPNTLADIQTHFNEFLQRDESLVVRCRMHVEVEADATIRRAFTEWCYQNKHDTLSWNDCMATVAINSEDVAEVMDTLCEKFPIVAMKQTEERFYVQRNESGFKTWRPWTVLADRARRQASSPALAVYAR